MPSLEFVHLLTPQKIRKHYCSHIRIATTMQQGLTLTCHFRDLRSHCLTSPTLQAVLPHLALCGLGFEEKVTERKIRGTFGPLNQVIYFLRSPQREKVTGYHSSHPRDMSRLLALSVGLSIRH